MRLSGVVGWAIVVSLNAFIIAVTIVMGIHNEVRNIWAEFDEEMDSIKVYFLLNIVNFRSLSKAMNRQRKYCLKNIIDFGNFYFNVFSYFNVFDRIT